MMDADYNYNPIYEQVHRMGHRSIIAYNKKNESEPIGFDKHFAPTCFREHSYRYDSYDAKRETLKYTRPKECIDCPLANEGICQKVYKVYITTDLRRYSAPVRGSRAWGKIFKHRTAVKRVNSYLKEFYQQQTARFLFLKIQFRNSVRLCIFKKSNYEIDSFKYFKVTYLL